MQVEAPKVALNYFRSAEFFNTVQVIGSMSIPYVVLISKVGFTWETSLTLLFSGIIGGMAKARKDLELSPNLYTPEKVFGTDEKDAIAYVAKNIALEQATREVISKNASDRINEVADEIISSTPIPELLKRPAKKASRDFLGRLFK
jgi:predicted nucleotidyltransferase